MPSFLARDLDRQERSVGALRSHGVFDHPRRRDGVLGHPLGVVAVRVRDQRLALHERKHLVAVPPRTVRDDLLDACVHLALVRVEEFLQRPRRNGENVEQNPDDGYLAEMRREAVARRKSEQLRNGFVTHEIRADRFLDFLDRSHRTTKSISIPINPIPP